MVKDIKYNVEARELLKEGVDALSNAVKVTLGPKGRNVIIDKKFGAPIGMGDQDRARIMVAIVDWNTRREVGSGTEAPTGTWDPEETTSVDEGPIIAYGSLFIDQSSTGGKMIDVQLPLNFYDTKAKPSGLYQIVISCSTSAYGDFMAGCKSNILYVDNFEWVY